MSARTVAHTQVAAQHYADLGGLLGELQFAFIAFVFGQSLEGYAQWKALLLLFLGCEAAALQASTQPLFAEVRVGREIRGRGQRLGARRLGVAGERKGGSAAGAHGVASS